MKFLLRVSFLLSCLSMVQSIYWDWGRCPKVSVKSDFDIEPYLGTWYEIVRYPAPFESFEDRCTQAVYSKIEEKPGYINVLNSGERPDGSIYSAEGKAWAPNADEPGKLKVKFDESFGPAGDYWVLDTDYETYTLVHSCQDFFIFHTQIDWILSRNRQLDRETMRTLYGKFTAEGVKTEPLQMSNQEGCDEETEIPSERVPE